MTVGAEKMTPGDWFGQPRGLTVLFLTEMWTQFSFYGMRALLVLYMTKQLLIPQQKASWIYGGYAAMVYLMPIFGGIIADRWIGRRNAVILGAVIMTAGHFLMSFENLLYVALATIAIGNGLFLPSLPSQIDGLYAREDPRRASAYTVYYVGINVGAFAAPLVVGTVGELVGFHYGFAIAGIGMIIAIATYLLGAGYLPKDRLRAERKATVAMGALTSSAVMRRFALLAGIAGAVVVFRGGYEQIGNTVTLWADQDVNRHVAGGFVIPITWFQALNPLIVFTLSPVLIALWTRSAAKGRSQSAVVRMVIGALLVAASFFLISAVSMAPGLVAWPWLAAFIVLMTIGELFILPIGLGLFGRLAPDGLDATTIALWYSAGFAGNLIAAWLGGFFSVLDGPWFFLLIGGVIMGSAALLAAIASPARRAEATA